MPRQETPPLTRAVVLRGGGLALAIALGALGVWLIATGDTTKHIQLGALASFWGLLIGAFATFGSRRPVTAEADQGAPLPAPPGFALELRSAAQLERAEEATLRREHEERLELMLRREIHSSVSREVAQLRAEIAQLRSELLDKVDGQLRLERIETTRLIGSDLEALQHELRELRHAARDGSDFQVSRSRMTDTASMRPIVEPARIRPVSRETAEVEADVQPARQSRPEPEPVFRAEGQPGYRAEAQPGYRADSGRRGETQRPVQGIPLTEQTVPFRMTAPEPRPAPVAAQPPAARAVPTPAPAARPGGEAAEPAPAEPTPVLTPAAQTPPAQTPPLPAPPAQTPPAEPAPVQAPAAQRAAAQIPPAQARPAQSAPAAAQPAPAQPAPEHRPAPAAPSAAEPRPASTLGSDPFAGLPRIRPFTDFELDPIEDEPSYTGRRRRREESAAANRGRHSRPAEDDAAAGRRRAPENGDDLLARLLARESARG